MAYENLQVMPELDPNKEYTIEELVDYIRNAMTGKNVREALARSVEATNEIAIWARDVAQGLVDGAFDAGELATMIESKLNQLEQDYAPKLTNLENEIEDARGNESSLGDRLNDFSSQLAQTENNLNNHENDALKHRNIFISVLEPSNAKANDIWLKPVESAGVYLNGTNAFINLDSAVNWLNSQITDQVTLEIVVRYQDVSKVQVIGGGQTYAQSSRYRYAMTIGYSEEEVEGNIRLVDNTGLYTKSSGASIDSKQHFTLVGDGKISESKLYKDGVLMATSATQPPNGISDIDHFLIGKDPFDSNRFLNGTIFEIRVWNRALSEQHINYYLDGVNGTEQNLLGCWELSEGAGNVVYDKTANKNHGTVVNGQWVAE